MIKNIFILLFVFTTVFLQAQTHMKAIVVDNRKSFTGIIEKLDSRQFIEIHTKDSLRSIPVNSIERIILKPDITKHFSDYILMLNGDRIRGTIDHNNPNDSTVRVFTFYGDSLIIAKKHILRITVDRRNFKTKPKEFPLNDFHEMIYLRNRDMIVGEIVSDSSDNITLRLPNKSEIGIARKDIERIAPSGDKFFQRSHNRYTSFGFGFGNGYGGIGVKFQQRRGGEMGFAYHLGLGLQFDLFIGEPIIRYNAGIKWYYYRNLYLDLAYGFLYRKQIPRSEIEVYNYYISLGTDLFIKRNFGFNVSLGIAPEYIPNNGDFDIFDVDENGLVLPRYLVVELGIIVKLHKKYQK
jgi:hypothetical protein